MVTDGKVTKRWGWVASLGDGTTLFEDGDNWSDLVKQCKNGDCQVTQVRLQHAGVTLIAAKDSGRGFVQYATVKINPKSGVQVPVKVLGTVVENLIFLTMIDNSRNVWQEIVPYTSKWDDKIIFIKE